MLQPRTKAILKGLVFGLGAFVVYFFIPLFLYYFALGILRDTFILYTFGPPEYQNWVSSLSAPGFPIININFGTIILLGLPISVAAFFLGLFKGETVGHGLSGIATQILFAIWFLLGVGTLGLITFFLNMRLPLYVPITSPPYVDIIYLNYAAPWIFNIQGIVNLFTVIILLVGLIYLVELGIGLKNRDYWRFSGK